MLLLLTFYNASFYGSLAYWEFDIFLVQLIHFQLKDIASPSADFVAGHCNGLERNAGMSRVNDSLHLSGYFCAARKRLGAVRTAKYGRLIIPPTESDKPRT